MTGLAAATQTVREARADLTGREIPDTPAETADLEMPEAAGSRTRMAGGTKTLTAPIL